MRIALLLSFLFLSSCSEGKSDDKDSDQGYEYSEMAFVNRWGNEIWAISDGSKFQKNTGECSRYIAELPEDIFIQHITDSQNETNFNSEQRIEHIELRCRIREVANRICMDDLLRQKGFDVEKGGISGENILEVMSKCSNPVTSVRVVK